jgi:hypothetical protein
MRFLANENFPDGFHLDGAMRATFDHRGRRSKLR